MIRVTTFACLRCGTVHGADFTIYEFKSDEDMICKNAGLPDCCEHEFVEAVDEDGRLIEPAHDICNSCGARRD